MCVIVTAEKGSMPTIDQLTRMSETNPDGAGIAWHDGNGLHRVRHSDNGKTLAFITEHWNELKATPCLIHFRLATHGAVNTENTHPFRYTLGNDDAYIEGWNDGYEAAINDMLNDGIDTTTGIRRR